MSQSRLLITAIAERIAPDEAEFSGEWLDAYLAGGKARRSLSPGPSVAGGALAENIVLVMPAVIWALAAIGPQLSGMLTESTVGDVCKALRSALDWMALREKARELPTRKAKANGDSPPSIDALRCGHEATARKLIELCNVFCRELEKRGNSRLKAQALCYGALCEMFSNPTAGVDLAEAMRDAPK